MEFELMHKNVSVAIVSIDEDGDMNRILHVHNLDHMPVGVVVNGHSDRVRLKKWWRGRCIPATRNGLRQFLEFLDLSVPTELLSKSYGLSLSDQYWVRPEGSGLTWDSLNFFDNSFSEDIGNLLLGRRSCSESISMVSPDNTSDGVLRKRWAIIDGKRCLLKSASGSMPQEPFNEVVASTLMDSLGVPHVRYTLVQDAGYPFSSCEDFINGSTELVTAAHLMATKTKGNDESVYRHYVRCCDDVGIDVVPALDQMLVVDYIMCNTDRHTNNFGLIRNAESLDYIGPAPLYDTGSSLGCNVVDGQFDKVPRQEPKPFAKSFEEQLGLVHSFDWVDQDRMYGCLDDISHVLGAFDVIPGSRRALILNLLKSRMDDICMRMH